MQRCIIWISSGSELNSGLLYPYLLYFWCMQYAVWIFIWVISLIVVFYFSKLIERKRIGAKIHNELANDILVKVLWLKKKIGTLEDKEVYLWLAQELELLGNATRQWSHDLYYNKENNQTDYHILIRKLVNNLIKPLDDCSVRIVFQWKTEEIKHSKRETQFVINFIRENMLNVIKHAAANTIFIDLWEEDEFLYIQIEDNGKGYNTVNTNEGIGKVSIQLDAKKINATIVYESGIGDGTTVRAKLKKKK